MIEGWRQVKLGQLCTTYAGGTPNRSKNEYFLNGTIPWVKSGEVENINITDTEEKVTERALKESSTRMISPNSILVALYGATAGEVGVLKVHACSNQAVLAVSSSSNNLDNSYLYYYLKSSTRKLLQLVQGSGQPNLSKKIIDSIQLLIPPLPEQQKIAEILSTVDDKINNIERQIKETEQLKKGMMQRLLTQGIGHTEFKDSPLGRIPKSWEVKKLGELCKTYAGGTPNRGKSKYYINGTIPWVKSGEVNNRNIEYAEEKVTDIALKETSIRMMAPNSILVALYGATAGEVGILRISACSNQAVLSVNSISNQLTNLYTYYYIKSSAKKMLSLVQGSGQPNLSKKVIDGMWVSLPSVSEQEKISENLENLDFKLDGLIEKMQNLFDLKKGLMQKLLTGQIRVNHLLDNQPD
jgi:type I restriction enzyme S subunit